MTYPPLVPSSICKTACTIELEGEGLNHYGEPEEGATYSGLCNWQEKAHRVLTDEQKFIVISGRAYFNGDILPDVDIISGGTITIGGRERRILKGCKARNADGTVNYTCLDVV